MKALTFHRVEDIRYDTVPDPGREEPDDVLVRVEWAGLCGSDLHPYFGREKGLDPGTVVGHEMVGEVVETGHEVSRFRKGQRVVSPFTTSCGRCFYCRRGLTARCERGQLFGWVEQGRGLNGGQAELVRVPLADSTLLAVPEGVAPELALLAGDVLATGFFCASMGDIEPGATVAVVGCGPVGLMAVIGAREHGAQRIFALDRVQERLDLARYYGAEPVDAVAVDPVEVIEDAVSGEEGAGEREKRRLGDRFGLSQFGANLVLLRPGCWSAQRHWHSHEDERVYVVSGELVLVTDAVRRSPTKTKSFVVAWESSARYATINL